MKRSPLPFLMLAGLAAIAISGCRSNLGGLPNVTGPGAQLRQAFENAMTEGPKVSSRVLHLGKIGSGNTIIADMPVPRPDTTPCTVTLFNRYLFKNFNNRKFRYSPPKSCAGPWAKVVLNFDVRVTKGTQYDRTGIIWMNGAVIYFGTTAEPSSSLAPHWHVERDVTDLSALFDQPSKGQVQLWNCYCPPTYNGYQIGTAYLQFYPPDTSYPAPKVPNEVIGIPYAPPLGNVATLPQSPMKIETTLPRNIEHAYLDLYLQSQAKEEQWFMCVPDDVWRQSKHALGFCRGTGLREGVVTVDGMPAGLAPIYPWIYTGGMDPNLWFPIPGLQTLEFTPYRVDLTPFAGVLSNGNMQKIDVSVFRAFDHFSGAGDLLLYTDPHHDRVSGKVTQDTAPATPDLVVENGVTYGSGTGLFGGSTAQGSIVTRSGNAYTISGYTQTGAGQVTTTVSASGLFVQNQSFNYTSSRYIQLLEQDTRFASTSATTEPNGHKSTQSASFNYPFAVSYPILTTKTGFKLPIKVYQGYRAQTSIAGHRNATVTIGNTVKSDDTMLFNPGFSWIGVKNGLSIQLYTYESKGASPICYGKEIESKNNILTSIAEPGCKASPPPNREPRI